MSEKGVLSARGEWVDFDLMKIKQQIASAPKAVTVRAREDFIDQKFKRRLKKQTQSIIDQVSEENLPPIEEVVVEEPIVIETTEPVKTKAK